jgi:hypothetical protein
VVSLVCRAKKRGAVTTPLPPEERERATKIFGQLGATEDGVVLNAVRALKELLRRNGLNLTDLPTALGGQDSGEPVMARLMEVVHENTRQRQHHREELARERTEVARLRSLLERRQPDATALSLKKGNE